MTFRFKERTQTQDPGVELNTDSQTYQGFLNESETTTLTFPDSALNKDATNYFNVSLPNLGPDAPPMTVGYDFTVQTSQAFGSPEYISEPYDLRNATEMQADINLSNAEGTFYYEYYDGNSWVQLDQTSLTTNGTYSLAPASPLADTTQVRARVTFSDTGPDPYAEITSDRVFFQAHGAYVQTTNTGPTATVNTDTPYLEAGINDWEFNDPQGDSVTAELVFDGSTAASTTLSNSGGVSHTPTIGPYYDTHTWRVDMTDDYDVSSQSNTFDLYGPLRFAPGSGLDVNVTGTTTMREPALADVYPFSNTAHINTTDGLLEVTASGDANATVAAADLEGEWTNLTQVDATPTTITADPGDKAQLSVSGAATDVAWSDYQPDDGQADAVLSGPDGTNSDVTFYGLSGDTTYSAVNATTGQVLAVSESTSFGQATFEIRHSEQTILLQTGDQSSPPEQANASPMGDLTQPPSDLSVDVSDPDFAGEDTVNVTIAVDGTQVLDTSITSNQTLSASLPNEATLGGTHTWYVNASDRFGNVNNQTYTYNVPSKIYIYNVTPNASGDYELIKGGVEVKATFAGSAETVLERTTTTGVIDFTGLPPDESYTVTLRRDGYFTRTAFVPSLYQQEAVFMLNDSAPSVQNTIQVEDRTGTFSDNPTLEIQHVINRSNVADVSGSGFAWVTIAGDRVGATDFFVANLQQDGRYRFTITNEQGDRRILGEYLAQSDGTFTLEIGKVTFSAEIEQGVAVQANAERQVVNSTTGATARYMKLIAFAGETDARELTYRILELNNDTVIASNTTVQMGDRQTVVSRNLTALDPNAPEDKEYRVEWWIEKGNGAYVSDTAYIGTMGPIGFGLGDNILNLIGWTALVAFAGLTALRSPKLSVTGTPIMAAGFTMFGVISVPTVLLVIAGAIGAFYLIGESQATR